MDMVYTHLASSFKLLKIRMIVVDPYAFFFSVVQLVLIAQTLHRRYRIKNHGSVLQH